ncbi:DUF4190 domain-containing protein [Streptomyces venezuelae]|uniref:DUF4190 domain-containing protein n=1 Tax=Streptomyces venezuelae TaxID=54571 RepID=UPI0034350EEA
MIIGSGSRKGEVSGMAAYDGSHPQGWQQPQPQQPPPGAAPGRGLAVAALVLGILACVLFWTVVGGVLLGLLAVILGIVAAVRARRGRAGGRGMAITGVVLGLLGLIASALIIALGVSILNSDSAQTFKECMKDANSQDDRRDCEKKFKKEFEKDWDREVGN